VKKSRFLLDAAIVGVLGVTVLGSTIALSMGAGERGAGDPVERVRRIIEERFVDPVDSEALTRGAIEGMLESLNDPYSTYVPPSEAANFRKDLTGEYVGIGAQITVRDGWLTIVTPLEDSPAFRAGLMPEDRVVTIDGESTFRKTADECVSILTGVAGDPVTLGVQRGGESVEIVIVRAPIKTRSVKGVHRDPADPERWNYAIDQKRRIAYVRITQFTPGVAGEVARALQDTVRSMGGLGGIIIDVRNNPGGVLEDAVRIADLFLDEGVILSAGGRTQQTQVIRARRAGTITGFPVAVLINEGSASASEVLAGALVDNGRAVVVGMRSFGKGSVQSVLELPEAGKGAQLKITEQYYYLPSGKLIHRKPDSVEWGVDPTDGFAAPMTRDEEREMFFARQEYELLRSGDQPGAEALEPDLWDSPEWIIERFKDKQLATALLAVQRHVDDGRWTPTGEARVEGSALVGEELASARLLRERMLRQLTLLDTRIESLQVAAGGLEPPPAIDLWDDEVDLTDGRLKIFDASGNKVVVLRITGSDLERWLIDAGVAPVEPEEVGAAPSPDGGE